MHRTINGFRQRRIAKFSELIGDGPANILDIGGTTQFWKSMGDLYGRPGVTITIVNLDMPESRDGNIITQPGDACDLHEFGDNAFDLVHSNSVIEHVGEWDKMEQMAREVRRLAPAYFVQTPNLYFPVEPHFRLPFVHWLPERLRARLLGVLGRVPRDAQRAYEAVHRIQLTDTRGMRRLFPDATIWPERVAGLTKSLVAIRAR